MREFFEWAITLKEEDRMMLACFWIFLWAVPAFALGYLIEKWREKTK